MTDDRTYENLTYIYIVNADKKVFPVEPDGMRGLRKRISGIEDKFLHTAEELPSIISLLRRHGYENIQLSIEKPGKEYYQPGCVNMKAVQIMCLKSLDRAKELTEKLSTPLDYFHV